MTKQKTPVYREIAADLVRRIHLGFYEKEARLPSQHELCRLYDISYMTACHVQEELERLGVIYKIRGKGVFIAPDSQSIKMPQYAEGVKRITLLRHDDGFAESYHYAQARIGILERAHELGLPVQRKLFTGQSRTALDFAEDEAVIIPYTRNCETLIPLLEQKRVRCIMLDNYYSQVYCVVADNYFGISRLLDHYESQGCRKIILCSRLFSDLGIANLSERAYAFENECVRRGMSYEILNDGNYNHLQRLVDSPRTRPDAILFVTDDSALKFIELRQDKKGRKKPLISGFNWSPSLPETLTTFRTDYEAMGRAAVDLIKNNSLEDWLLPQVIHVRGKSDIVVGQGTATDGKPLA